jgi:diguanylate cyclase
MGSALFLRLLAALLLIAHILLRALNPSTNLLVDLFLYNAVAATVFFISVLGTDVKNRVGRYALSFAIFAWASGSILTSATEFYTLPGYFSTIANVFYVLFYPSLFMAIPRLLIQGVAFSFVDIIDSAILCLGLSSVGAAFAIEPVLPHFSGNVTKTFFAIFFAIADLVLLTITLSIFVARPNLRSGLFALGISIFAISDFLFLWLSANSHYSLGLISDDGWLLGILLITLATSLRSKKIQSLEMINPLFIALSVMLSATLLAINALRPGYFPGFIIVPTISTLLLAFFRMTIALRQAKSIGDERVLARTDDLTGLPNRRRFIAELNLISKTPNIESALLLLDLDGFKPINDKYGHEVGDELLRQVSQRFSRALPSGSLLARLGGDEFGAIIRGDRAMTIEVAQALRATLSYPFAINNAEIKVGVSVGHVNNDGSPDLLRRADNAMYQAKNQSLGVWSDQGFQ